MLTKTDLTALRKADDVTFHYVEGRHIIRAHKRVRPDERERDPFAVDRVHEIEVEGFFSNYEASYTSDSSDVHSCFSMLHATSLYDSIFGSIARNYLRVGDELAIKWGRGAGSNKYVKDASLAVDTLTLRVTRGKKITRFLLDFSVTRRNSARMTRSAVEAR